jgi:hypothetical protein
MPTTIYKIGKIMQVIDINDDSTNFEAEFHVQSEKGKHFQMLVVDQATLDGGELNFKKIEGTITGKVRADRNNKTNHYIALKADEDCNVSVTINRVNLPESPIFESPASVPSHEQFDQELVSVTPIGAIAPQPTTGMSNTKIVIITLVVIGGIIALYFLYMRTDSESDVDPIHSSRRSDHSRRSDYSRRSDHSRRSDSHRSERSLAESSIAPSSRDDGSVHNIAPVLGFSKSSTRIQPDVSSRGYVPDGFSIPAHVGTSLLERLRARR